jgi:hypothetical protein
MSIKRPYIMLQLMLLCRKKGVKYTVYHNSFRFENNTNIFFDAYDSIPYYVFAFNRASLTGGFNLQVNKADDLIIKLFSFGLIDAKLCSLLAHKSYITAYHPKDKDDSITLRKTA